MSHTTYHTIEFKALGNTWTACVASGLFNYVQITKMTNNPFRGMGKQFDTWEAAAASYRSPAMKTALLMAELNLTAQTA